MIKRIFLFLFLFYNPTIASKNDALILELVKTNNITFKFEQSINKKKEKGNIQKKYIVCMIILVERS